MLADKILRLVISLAVCYGIGFIGSLYAIPLLPTWFASLNKPGFIPPDPVFMPVGIVIYLLLGLSLFFIWSADLAKRDTMVCLYLFVCGLTLNFIWIYIFFGLKSPFMAFATMIMLIGILISTIFQSFRVSIKACILLIPYLIITLILMIANYQIYVMNPDLPLLVI